MITDLKIAFKNWIEQISRVRGDTENRYGKLRLDKNERVTPFDANFFKSLQEKITQDVVQAYPEPERFYALLAEHHQKSIEQFLLTAGSDTAIRTAFDLCVKPGDEVVSISPTFAMVEVYCELFGAVKRFVPFKEDLSLDIEQLIQAIRPETSLVVIANPNSPTGTAIELEEMVRIAGRALENEATLLVDEAYGEFWGKDCFELIDQFPNVIVTRTFSKACGLAGLRIGYLAASLPLAKLLYKFRPMYETNSVALLFAEEILKQFDKVEQYAKETLDGKQFLIEFLKQKQIAFVDTKTNFIHIDFGNKKSEALQKFQEAGILVRGGLPIAGFENYLRLTLAPEEAMRKITPILESLNDR